MRNSKKYLFILFVVCLICGCIGKEQPVTVADNPFPFCLEFFHNGVNAPLDPASMQKLLDSGVDRIFVRHIQTPEDSAMVAYAESLGMKIELMTHGYELLNRNSPPPVSVYDPAYTDAARASFEHGLADLKKIKNPGYVYPFQDEPFHILENLDYSPATRAEFKRCYGYDMPVSFGDACRQPRTQLDFINFQADIFRDGWLISRKMLEELFPGIQVAITHDSHNVYGSGVMSNSQMAIDDIYHWGGDYADLFVYDIYPYLTFDYRYGEMGRIRRPRMSQLHYTMAQMRNMTAAYAKKMGFWVGTYNPAWFVRFHGLERKQQFWSEHEVSWTAIAGGCDYLISPSASNGNNQPVDTLHWATYSQGMRVIQKAGKELLIAPKVKARAAFLFPRTQHILLQEEYYNVGVVYEFFLRTLGELDIIHEEQIIDEKMNGYEMLVMCDVKLLPRDVAGNITRFVENGGILLADCLPQTDEDLKPLDVLKKVFGISKAVTDRIRREGQWVPFAAIPVKMSFPPENGVENSSEVFDRAQGVVPGGKEYDFKITSPRPMDIDDAKTLLGSLQSGTSLTEKIYGKGHAYMLGFCVQDTYFQAWKEYDDHTRTNMADLVTALVQQAGVRGHVHSSNPDIEAALRANENVAFVLVINHETYNPQTTVSVSVPGFDRGRITNVENGQTVAHRRNNGTIEIDLEVSWGTTKLLKISK